MLDENSCNFIKVTSHRRWYYSW